MQQGHRPVHLLLRAPRQVAELRAGQWALRSHGSLDRFLVGAGLGRLRRGEQQRQQPRRDARRDPRHVLADADEPLGRQVVLGAPEEGQRLRPAQEVPLLVADRPVVRRRAVHLLPQRRQHHVRLGEEQGEPHLFDPGGGGLERAHH